MSVAEASIIDAPPGAPMALGVLFDQHMDFVWRSLRRLGVSTASVDDATQEVFLVVARKLERIFPGSERAFLFGVALRIASDLRRRQPAFATDDAAFDDVAHPGHAPDELVDRARARAVLDKILDGMGIDLRAVFVLCELEGMTMTEVASCLDLPNGTVASRLRRGRELFEAQLKRLQARSTRHE